MSGAWFERSPLPTLVRALRELYERAQAREESAARERERVVGLLREERWSEVPAPPANPPVTRYLPELLAGLGPPAEGVVAAARSASASLPWAYAYPPRADAPDLRERIAFAEMVGPAAPLRCETHCLGLTLIAPFTRYPLHHHPAVELYLVLSGTARWTAAGRVRAVEPLGLVLHPSGVLHAMETSAEPLLAAYAWTGSDVRTASRYAEEPSPDR